MTNRFRITLVILTLLLAACATKPERIVLLPQEGRSTSIVVIGPTGGQVTLAEPYAQALVTDRETSVGKSDAETVAKLYSNLLSAMPVTSKSFVLYFATGGNELTSESAGQLPVIVTEVASTPAAEVVVIGHTDTVGSLGANDALSLRRAQLISDRLISAGVPAGSIISLGRGKREPLVPTADEMAEPRNRRVEIKVR